MTPGDFRRLALALPETAEGSHMGHVDFRVGGKIFASLGYPDEAWGMVSVQPDQQQMLAEAEPGMFEAVKGYWGSKGATLVRLEAADEVTLISALRMAWRRNAAKKLAHLLDGGGV